MSKNKKIAIVHDYFNQYGGSEKVVEAWLNLYPGSHIYTSIFVSKNFLCSKILQKAYQEGRIKTSWLQFFLPVVEKFFKPLFWLYPIIMSWVSVKGYDLVLISSTYCGKNIKLKNCSKIIHYCHSPTRFLHQMDTEVDHSSLHFAYQLLLPFFKFFLKVLDLRAVKHLNSQNCLWVANSSYIQKKIQQAYQTSAEIIYPPVDIQSFLKICKKPATNNPFYFYFGRISFHKRVDLLVEACLQSGRRLIVAGSTSFQRDMLKLNQIIKKHLKTHPKDTELIKFVGRVSNQEVYDYLASCQGFLFAGQEDFGIAPVEALASGTPLIMYQAGGALEYLKPKVNGIFFAEQTPASLIKTLAEFESLPKTTWQPKKIKDTAENFSINTFEKEFLKITCVD